MYRGGPQPGERPAGGGGWLAGLSSDLSGPTLLSAHVLWLGPVVGREFLSDCSKPVGLDNRSGGGSVQFRLVWILQWFLQLWAGTIQTGELLGPSINSESEREIALVDCDCWLFRPSCTRTISVMTRSCWRRGTGGRTWSWGREETRLGHHWGWREDSSVWPQQTPAWAEEPGCWTFVCPGDPKTSSASSTQSCWASRWSLSSSPTSSTWSCLARHFSTRSCSTTLSCSSSLTSFSCWFKQLNSGPDISATMPVGQISSNYISLHNFPS